MKHLHRAAGEIVFGLCVAVAVPATAILGGVGWACEWIDRRRGIYT